jgi:hypothetical protein
MSKKKRLIFVLFSIFLLVAGTVNFIDAMNCGKNSSAFAIVCCTLNGVYTCRQLLIEW